MTKETPDEKGQFFRAYKPSASSKAGCQAWHAAGSISSRREGLLEIPWQAPKPSMRTQREVWLAG